MIAEAFEAFRMDVIPVNAPPVQVEECRKAFYAGATALLYGVMSDLDEGPEATDADTAILDGVAKELHAFADGLVK